jgi:glycosyltransferase involved in cell wall biosynthesis
MRLRVLSNLAGLGRFCDEGAGIDVTQIDPRGGAWAGWRVFWQSFRFDVVLLDGNPAYLWLLCLLRWLWPLHPCRLVVLDVMFVLPVGPKQRLKALVMKVLLARVDHFIHYFKDLEAYQRYFGVGPRRSTFVPFKVNDWEALPPEQERSSEGSYVFSGGRSLRDVDTFLGAMRRLPYPGLLLYHDLALVRENGTPLSLDDVPPNVKAVEDDGSSASWMAHVRGAKVVVVATLPSSIRAIGVSTYLLAMALRKVVVMTEGAATREVVQREAVLAPPADAEALAAAIRLAWEDDGVRRRCVAAGREMAERAGGTARLYADVVEVCARVCGRGRVAKV